MVEDIRGERLKRLLEIGFLEKQRPLEQFLEQLSEPDGTLWFAELMKKSPIAAFGSPEELLVNGNVPLETLKGVKDEAERKLQRAHRPDEHAS